MAVYAAGLTAQGHRIENKFVEPGDAPIRIAENFNQQTSAASSSLPFSPANRQLKTLATNLKGFGVPFQINAADAAFIEVQLYLSRDQGRSWKFQSRQSTDAKDFPFQADEDGEYWFALKTLNRDRKLLPEGVPQPELKIVVDTVKPTLDFRVETDAAGRVICRWRAEDNNLAPDSLRIFYQPITSTGAILDWVQVPVNLGGIARGGVYADQLAWWPETTQSRLNVAVEIKDVANNIVRLDRQVTLPQTAWRKRNQSTAQITDAPPVDPSTVRNPWAPPEPVAVAAQSPRIASTSQPPAAPPAAAPPAAPHPANVVCNDGVCTVIPRPQRVAQQLDPTIIGNGTVSSVRKPSKPVGSEIEFVAPPVPEGYVDETPTVVATPAAPKEPSVRVAQVPGVPFPVAQDRDAPVPVAQSTPNSGSVAWPSQTESWGPKNQSHSSTTRQPDPSIAPHPFPTTPPRTAITHVPGNPPKTTIEGDQVVSQSTTMGPRNQYRGLHSQENVPIPSPELLPEFSPGFSPGFSNANQSSSVDSQADRRAGEWGQSTGADRGSPGELAQPNQFSNTGFHSPGQPASRPQVSEMPARETRAPSHIIGSRRFRLDYGIDSIDPSGVARVDLWMTRDEGRTWNAWGSDPDNQSPFPVEIQEQGRYGFRIVVHSKDGLTGQGPSSGDDADMWVLVDTQPPLTRIKSVPYGRGNEAGRLVINYSVADDFLTVRPITLGYSSNPDGPWNLIEAGVRNAGRYVWKVQPNVPDRVFLRIEAIDKAGNVGVHVLSQSIDISGLVPRGTIHGVVPVGTGR